MKLKTIAATAAIALVTAAHAGAAEDPFTEAADFGDGFAQSIDNQDNVVEGVLHGGGYLGKYAAVAVGNAIAWVFGDPPVGDASAPLE